MLLPQRKPCTLAALRVLKIIFLAGSTSEVRCILQSYVLLPIVFHRAALSHLIHGKRECVEMQL